jgi:hypothetical protein
MSSVKEKYVKVKFPSEKINSAEDLNDLIRSHKRRIKPVSPNFVTEQEQAYTWPECSHEQTDVCMQTDSIRKNDANIRIDEEENKSHKSPPTVPKSY